ncbi:restriction endonuclease [Desulfosporosinus nitroreducens]|uniref:restriction endonuclease n=1 Tax=Desulfosporosinus nitroreducens TaxID=2018668 RepID=UPI00207C7C65|nr:restriction endonuclease [Desulfosporosinus nitroreducens]MCO1600023.1 pentapeptide repeat-containing protein [Desulfosporosinus nitroreducens]
MTISKMCVGFGDKVGRCKNVASFPKESPFCNNCAGKSFEYQIAQLFRIQGYNVNENIKVASTQHDFFASLTYGFLEVGILVECKWKFETTDTVNGVDVRKFSGSVQVFNKEMSGKKADKAFLVTNGNFAPEAKEVASSLDITLYTQAELLHNLIKFEPYLKRLVSDYENSNLNGHYISLNSKSGSTLINQINDLLLDHSNNALVILGDYGAGKTSFCLRLCYMLASDILRGKNLPLPILIHLRDYSKAVDMEQLVTDLLINKCKIPNGNYQTFLELLRTGHFLLIFDGFDEIAKRVDYSTKHKVFSEICKYVSENSKVLVTCRANFFNQKEEFEKIFQASALHFEPNHYTVNFTEIEIDDLNEEQIINYISSYKKELTDKGYNVKDFLDILRTTHDLFDLAKRPVLLNVILETIPRLTIQKGSKINAATLYDLYTGFWLQREDSKGKTLIKSSEKIMFMKHIAWKMFETNLLSINFRVLPNEINKYFKIDIKEDIDHFSHDILSCSFLNRDELGNYKFIHKSFMEYFVASKIVTDLVNYRHKKPSFINNVLGQSSISMEVGLFIRDILENSPLLNSITQVFNSIDFGQLNSTAKKNALTILSKLDGNIAFYLNSIKTNDLSGVDLSFALIENVDLRDMNMIGANFFSAKISNVKFDGSSLVDSIFRKAFLNNVSFEEVTLETTDFYRANVTNSSFFGSDMAYSHLVEAVFLNCDFEDAELSGSETSMTQFNNCKNMDTICGLPYSVHLT